MSVSPALLSLISVIFLGRFLFIQVVVTCWVRKQLDFLVFRLKMFVSSSERHLQFFYLCSVCLSALSLFFVLLNPIKVVLYETRTLSGQDESMSNTQ